MLSGVTDDTHHARTSMSYRIITTDWSHPERCNVCERHKERQKRRVKGTAHHTLLLIPLNVFGPSKEPLTVLLWLVTGDPFSAGTTPNATNGSGTK